MTKHVARPDLKIVLDGPREELRMAILEVEAADASSAQSQAAVKKAEDQLRTAKSGHAGAVAALEEATAPPGKPLAEKLAGVRGGSDEYFRILEAHEDEPPRRPVTIEDLKRMRQTVADSEDVLTIERNAVEVAEAHARTATSALNRASDRRTRAVQALVAPNIAKLMADVDLRVQELVAARAALAFVSSNLVDGYSEERRRASFALNDGLSFPEEAGLKVDRDTSKRQAAIEAWRQFEQAIKDDASAPFPSL